MDTAQRKNRITKRGRQRAQMALEYMIMFTVITAAIIFAATNMIKPSVNKLMNDVSKKINQVGTDFLSH